jgi:hypothetical protein
VAGRFIRNIKSAFEGERFLLDKMYFLVLCLSDKRKGSLKTE